LAPDVLDPARYPASGPTTRSMAATTKIVVLIGVMSAIDPPRAPKKKTKARTMKTAAYSTETGAIRLGSEDDQEG